MTSVTIDRPVPTPTPAPDRHRRRAARIAREATLNVMAVGGALCLLAVIASLVFGVTLVMFRTGSMAPTIPAGSVAVVREIPASEAEVGDVVTVARPGLLPITHRVVEVETGADGLTALTLRGDANPVADPAPYRVRTVRLVEASTPGVAHLLSKAGSPQALGLVTLLVASVVTWTLWPRPEPAGEEG